MNIKAVPTGCPKCGSQLWDNRAGKKNPKAPDFKCKNKSCDGCFWPPSNKDPFQWADEANATGHRPTAPDSAPSRSAPSGLSRIERYWQLFDETLDRLNTRSAGLQVGGERIPVDLTSINAMVATQFISENNGR